MILFYWLISIMPLTQHPLWGRFVGELTLFKYVGAACFLYAIVYLGARRTFPSFFHTWQGRCFVILYVMAAVSFFTKSLPMDWKLGPLMSYTSFLLLFVITLSVVDSLERLRWVLLVSIGSVAFASLYVLREWQKYHDLFRGFRPGWVVGDANYFSVSALLCLPLGFYFLLERRPRWEKLFCLSCTLVTLMAVTLAASRGGFLGLVAALLFIVWRSRQRVRNLVLASALLVPLSLMAPSSPMDRFLNPQRWDREATEARVALWNAGLRMVREHPLAGTGLGNFKPLVGRYLEPGQQFENVAHNTYIEIAAEMGLPALLVFLGILVASFWTLERVRVRTQRYGPMSLHQAALGLQGGLVAFAVAIFFISAQYQKLFWLMVFLSMCTPLVAVVYSTKRSPVSRQEGEWIVGGSRDR